MRWYDIFVCIWLADMIAAGIMTMNIFVLTLGILSYILYEDMRKEAQ